MDAAPLMRHDPRGIHAITKKLEGEAQRPSVLRLEPEEGLVSEAFGDLAATHVALEEIGVAPREQELQRNTLLEFSAQ